MSDPHRDDRDDRDAESLARALKRAADTAARAAAPEPAGHVTARGLRRRRRNLAALATCAVCLLAGSGAALGLRLQQSDPVPPASVPTNGSPSPGDDSGPPSLRPSPSFPSSSGSGSASGSASASSSASASADSITATPSGLPPSFSPRSGSSVTPTTPAR